MFELDVKFEKIQRLGTDCSRYLPLLSEKAWSSKAKQLYQNLDMSRKDLSLIPVEEYWNVFLEFYVMTRYVESLDGSTIFFYRLKSEIIFKLPPKLALIQAIPQTGVCFDSLTTVLTAKPVPGRALEHLLFEGTFKFNEGSVFQPLWRTYTL